MTSNKRTRRNASRRANPTNSAMARIVRPPPGTTQIVIPGELAAIDTVAPYQIAFSVDSNSLLGSGSYVPLANVYRYYRLKKVIMRVSMPNTSTATTGYLASSLQYVQPVNNPQAITARQILNLRPNKETKAWQHHTWIWQPHRPADFDFTLISNNTDYATVYVGLADTNYTPVTNVNFAIVRFNAVFEFYGLQGVTRSISHKKADEDDEPYGFAE